MKRFHVHVAVDDLARSTRFYSALFATEPTVIKPDYAKWMLDDPRVNFAISRRGAAIGLNHLGVQVESGEELAEMHTRLQQLESELTEQVGTACCYVKSNKYWATDPQGIAWETFHTLDSIPVFGAAETKQNDACCVPTVSDTPKATSGCCTPLAKTATGECC